MLLRDWCWCEAVLFLLSLGGFKLRSGLSTADIQSGVVAGMSGDPLELSPAYRLGFDLAGAGDGWNKVARSIRSPGHEA